MNNSQLIARIASKLGRDKGDVSKLLEAFAGVLRARCGELDSVAIPGFGTFEAKKRPERVVTVPNGKRVLVPPKVVMNFKVSNVLKNKLRPAK